MQSETLTVHAGRLPDAVAVGQHLELRVSVIVQRIEAELIDVSGYNARGAIALLGGEVDVTLAIQDVDVLTPDSELVRVEVDR